MTEKLEHSWVKEIFTPDELKQYAEFEAKMKTKHKKEAFETQWQQLLKELKQNMNHDPNSTIGIQTGKNYMEWINSIYGKQYAHLRTKKWEKGFGDGKGLEDIGLTPEIMAWLEKALDAYWNDRFYGILEQVGKVPNTRVLILWNEALDDMYGEENSRKQAVYDIVLNDERVSPEAKTWIKSIMAP